MEIRPACEKDVSGLAALTSELGYAASDDDVRARVGALSSNPDHVLLVALDAESRLVGWLHASVRRELQHDAFVEVVGLVVSKHQRSAGVGAELLAGAEAWTRGGGLRLVRVRCNVRRERAHRFYQRAGYELVKTAHLFAKQLEG